MLPCCALLFIKLNKNHCRSFSCSSVCCSLLLGAQITIQFLKRQFSVLCTTKQFSSHRPRPPNPPAFIVVPANSKSCLRIPLPGFNVMNIKYDCSEKKECLFDFPIKVKYKAKNFFFRLTTLPSLSGTCFGSFAQEEWKRNQKT